MLDTIFLQLYDMSKIASLVILAVLLVRLCLKGAPKIFSYALWAIVLFRLLCPVSIEAPISLLPQTEPSIEFYALYDEPITPLAAVDAAQQALGDVLNGGIGTQHVKTTELEADGTRRIITTDWWNVWMLSIKHVWLFGMSALLIYSSISLIRLKRRLIGAAVLRDNIYLADHIDSPFVMGLVRPKIYLPSSCPEAERSYILLHEQHHIRRGDHIIKLLAFAALCLHCFNPLVWIAFILSGKDMEMSCDEAVLRKLGSDIRADYSASLVSLATGRRIIAGAPLAFGEGNTEGRIKNIAKWKKPALRVTVMAMIVCAVPAVCLMTNPMNRDTMLLGAEYRIAEILYRTDESYTHTDNDSPGICLTADYCLYVRDTEGNWNFVGRMEPYPLTEKELADYTASAAGWLRHYRAGKITDSYILRLHESEYHAQLYLACRTQKGDVLLGVGVEDIGERGQGASDDTALHVLLRLESTFGGTHLSGEFHERSLARTVGGDVEIFHTHYDESRPNYMIVAFRSDDSSYQDGVQMPSPEKTDMGFAVFYQNKDESGYRLLQCRVYADAALAENGIFLCPDPAVLDLEGEMKPDMTYDVILLNNEKIEKATRIWEYADGETETQSKGYLNGHEMLLFSWKNEKAGCRVRQYFYDAHDELIDYSSIVKNETAPNTRVWVSDAVHMTPTTANITGAFDGYLYLPIDGATYRYELIFEDPASVTKGSLMHQFTEEADPQNVEWRVYTVDDYPDRSVVLAEAGEDYVHLYRYSPSKAVEPAMLEKAKADGKVVLENGYATSGQAAWNIFCRYAEQGKRISVNIVHYHTLQDRQQYDEKYYEAHKEDYPALYEFDVTYDGSTYTMKWQENGTEYIRTYKYLRVFEDTLRSSQSAKKPQAVIRYVLTNDNDASLDELWYGLASSQLGDYIDFYTIYSEKK